MTARAAQWLLTMGEWGRVHVMRLISYGATTERYEHIEKETEIHGRVDGD